MLSVPAAFVTALWGSRVPRNRLVLGAQGAREIAVAFTPQTNGRRTATLTVEHDWIGGGAALALIGSASTQPALPANTQPIGTSGGGGGAMHWVMLGAIALLAGIRLRTNGAVRRKRL